MPSTTDDREDRNERHRQLIACTDYAKSIADMAMEQLMKINEDQDAMGRFVRRAPRIVKGKG